MCLCRFLGVILSVSVSGCLCVWALGRSSTTWCEWSAPLIGWDDVPLLISINLLSVLVKLCWGEPRVDSVTFSGVLVRSPVVWVLSSLMKNEICITVHEILLVGESGDVGRSLYICHVADGGSKLDRMVDEFE